MRGYRMKHPDKIIRAYSNVLVNIILSIIKDVVQKEIINNIDILVTQYKFDDEKNNGFFDFIGKAFTSIKTKVKRFYDVPDIARQYASEVSSFNKKEVAKSVSKSFVDYLIPDFSEALNGFVNNNVALINGLIDDTQKAIVMKIANGVRNGATAGQIARSIEKNIGEDNGIYKTVRTKLALIAQDQINKLNGQLNMLRQQAIGISKYTWRTRLDDRVRDYDAKKEGEIYSWDNPPEGGHPGEKINCRCFGEPVLSKKLQIFLNKKDEYAIS
jgi:SPP1 gp7 family putative phage head morphogenesis protein